MAKVLEFDDISRGSPGWDLGDLNDVLLTSVSSDQVLYYDAPSGLWKNKTQSGTGGDVTGPASAVANAIVSFDSTTGKLIKDSGLVASGGEITTGAWKGTPVAIAYGGTGAATAAANKVFAGPTTGGAAAPSFRSLVADDIPSLSSIYQPLDAALTSISSLTTAADTMIYATALDTYTTATLTAAGRAILDDATAADQRATLSVPALVGTSTDNAFVRFDSTAGQMQNSQTKEDDAGNVVVVGNLTVQGQTFQADHKITTGDTFILVNHGETGVGVTNVRAGLDIDRGTLNPYRFQFHETSDDFRVGLYYVSLPYTALTGAFQAREKVTGATSGAIGYVITDNGSTMTLRGTATAFTNGETITGATSLATATAGTQVITDQTQAVATREDSPSSAGLAYWNVGQNRFDTATGVTATATGLTAHSFTLNTNPSVTPVVGMMYWDAAEGVPAVMLSASTTMTIGTESYIKVVNKTGVEIPDGSVVYVSGAQGNRPTATLARADALTTSSVIGIATHSIADNAEGFVTISGDVHGYNTSGFSAGDKLYLSATNAGQLTNTAPASPYFVVLVATALNSTNNGLITVHPRAPLAGNTSLGTDNIVGPTQAAVKSYADGIGNACVILAPGSSTRNVIQPTADYTALIIKAYSSQTATLQEWQNSSGTVLASISSTGDLTKIAGITYAWPTSQGAANTQLQNNGSGTLSWATPTWLYDATYHSLYSTDSSWVSTTNNARSIVAGYQAGYQATNAPNSVMLGVQAGYQATSAVESAFIGYTAGYKATSAARCVFIGYSAGGMGSVSTPTLTDSYFIGYTAGQSAKNASYSLMIGNAAGQGSTNASDSIFIGRFAGQACANAACSNFLGYSAGQGNTNASYSNLFGYNVGALGELGYELGSNNIIIGTNITLPNATANSMNIGGVLFGSGFYATTTGDPSYAAVSAGRIGIGIVSPTTTLDVAGTTHLQPTAAGNIGLVVQGYASQSANLLDIQNSSGTALASIAALGGLTISASASTGAPTRSLTVNVPAHTALTASTEHISMLYNGAVTQQFATGALTLQRFINIAAPTYSFVGASTITTAATLSISGAPAAGTNATITNAYALQVVAGNTYLGGDVFTDRYNTASATNTLLGIGAAGAGNLVHTTGVTGYNNTIIGNEAGRSITSSYSITAVGHQAAYSATSSGIGLTAIGWNAAYSTNANYGVYVGYNCGRNAAGAQQVLIGNGAGYYAAGTGTVAIGDSACKQAGSATVTGLVGIGFESLKVVANTGNNNTALGYQSGVAVTSGASNTLLGYQAGNNLTTGGSNILIGASVAASAVGVSNELNIGGLIKGNMTGVITTAQIYGPDGAVATPAYSFQSDTNTGIYWVSADKLAIATGGVQRILFDDAGKIGIGTASPAYKLHVAEATAATNAVVAIDCPDNSSSAVLMFKRAGVDQGSIAYTPNATAASHKLAFNVAAGDRVTILGDGSVGIGTATPDQPLAFADSLAVKMQLNGNNANGYQMALASAVHGGDAMIKFIAGETAAGEFGVYTTTNLRFLVNKDGYVGIGNSAPGTSLEVGNTTSTLDPRVIVTDQYVAGLRLSGSRTGNDAVGALSFYNRASGDAQKIIAEIVSFRDTADAKGNLVFNTHNGTSLAERMRIDNTGNVGLNTASPSSLLHVNGIIQHAGTFGSIYVSDASTATSVATGATYTKINSFTNNGPSNDCTVDHTNDQITLTRAGKYLVVINWSGSVSTANSSWDFAAFIGTTEQAQIHSSRKFSNNDIGAVAVAGILTASANDIVSLRVKHDQGGSENITTHDCSLAVHYIGA
jgi:hypothetical protein